jgi:uncharacterized coiled-coil protein SlyX
MAEFDEVKEPVVAARRGKRVLTRDLEARLTEVEAKANGFSERLSQLNERVTQLASSLEQLEQRITKIANSVAQLPFSPR